MIDEALIQYVEGKIYPNIDDYTLTDIQGSIKEIQITYRTDFGKDISAILLKDVISILKLKYNKTRKLRQKVVLDGNALRSYPG